MSFRRRLVPLAVLTALLALPATAGAANELANGSFESGRETWVPLGATLTVRAGGVHGDRYGQAARRSGAWFGLYTNASPGAQPGQRLTAGATVRAPRGRRVCIRIREKHEGKTAGQSVRCVRASGRWQRPAATRYTARRAGGSLSVAVYERRGASRNWLNVDNVTLVAAPLGPGPDGTPEPGTVVVTDRPWECNASLAAHGKLPIKVVSTIPNPGNDNAINLRGCYGDGDPNTIDLILDVRGNGADIGTAYDAVRVGQNAHDLVVTGNVECGARYGSIHQDIVQALSGNRVTFVDFTSGDPTTGRWTCWGAGGGWYVNWSNGTIPTDLLCLRCKLATYNQNMRIDESVRSGARDSVFGYSRSYGIVIGPLAQNPINVNNQVIRY